MSRLVQVAALLRSWVVPSLKPARKRSFELVPAGRLKAGGVTVALVRTAEVTVNGVDPVTPSKVALMRTRPGASPRTLPVGVMLVTELFELL